MKQILKAIKKFDTIIIHGHEHPDGDCLGSQIGLKDIILTNFPNKKVYVVGENADYLSFIGNVDIIDDSLYNNALAIIVDLANKERASDSRFINAKYIIRIDHHIYVEKFADYEYINSDLPSCSEIIVDFARKFKLKMSKIGANALYTGIITDTGRFKYDSVKAHTHEIAAYLLNLGVNPQEIDNYLSVDTFEVLKLKGYLLSNFKITNDGVAYIKMTRDVIESYNVKDEEAANLVNMLGTIKGVCVWFLVIEYETGIIKVRIRSKGPSINEFACKYNGGGHKKASGAKLSSWDELPLFIEDINNLVKEYKKLL